MHIPGFVRPPGEMILFRNPVPRHLLAVTPETSLNEAEPSRLNLSELIRPLCVEQLRIQHL
jgi:hypothetical protein